MTNDDGQLGANFFQQLRVALFRRYYFRERQNYLASRYAPLLSLKRIGLLFSARITAGILVE